MPDVTNLVKAKKRISNAGIAGGILALITVFQSFLPIMGFSPATFAGFIIHASQESAGEASTSISGFPLFWFLNLLNLLVVLGLTIGVFRRKEICAILLFSFCILALIPALPTAVTFLGLPIVIFIAILIFLFQGMLGTFDYHSLMKKGVTQEKQ